MPPLWARPQDFELWPENWPAFELFLFVQNNWRFTGGQVIGLEYSVVFEFARMLPLDGAADRLGEIVRFFLGDAGPLDAVSGKLAEMTEGPLKRMMDLKILEDEARAQIRAAAGN